MKKKQEPWANDDCLVRVQGRWHMAHAGAGDDESWWYNEHEGAIARLGAEDFFFPLDKLGEFLDSLGAHSTAAGVLLSVKVGKRPLDVPPGGAVWLRKEKRGYSATRKLNDPQRKKAPVALEVKRDMKQKGIKL